MGITVLGFFAMHNTSPAGWYQDVAIRGAQKEYRVLWAFYHIGIPYAHFVC